MKCLKVSLGSSQIGTLLRLVRRERAVTESKNLSTESCILSRIEKHLMKGLNPAMKPFLKDKEKEFNTAHIPKRDFKKYIAQAAEGKDGGR